MLLSPALEVAPHLLGAHLRLAGPDGAVTLRVTEVEAYHGVGAPGPYDAGSHARDRKTERNAAMFGPPGHAYVYFTYGMHHALNVVCSPAGIASGVLIRAGQVIAGTDVAQARRLQKQPRARTEPLPDWQLARGPGNAAAALGLTLAHGGLSLFDDPFLLSMPERMPVADDILRGPRVGVAGAAGGPNFPWRFWLKDEPSVSAFRPGRGAPRPGQP